MDYSNTNNKIYGIPEGCLIGQQERVDEINDRIMSRHISDINLEPNFDPRPQQTKYTVFGKEKYPVSYIDSQKNATSIKKEIYYSPLINFYPGTQPPPTSGYRLNVDLETELRNQHVPLKHGYSAGVYIPSSNSDLFFH